MIDPRYVQTMARYNTWQNQQLLPVLQSMSMDDLTVDRGGFFGGILPTANHLLWGDTLWMSRFDPSVEAPTCAIPESIDLHLTVGSWAADRFRLDGKIAFWAQGVRALDLKGDISWFSGAAQRTITTQLSVTIIHFFNHQTHHRGQIHAMLTAAGQKAPVSDLFIMPEEP